MSRTEAMPIGTTGATALARPEVEVMAEPAVPPLAPSPIAFPADPDLGRLAAGAGLRGIHMLAWRDLDDPEAGGSEVHASTVAKHWAAAGIDVTIRTSSVIGQPMLVRRDGYRVVRKAGRYTVFPRTMLSGLIGRTGPRDALVEIWNGMPFLSPVWAKCPRIVFLHHVHGDMWRMVLKPPALARLGELIEYRLAPPLYRNTQIVTLSHSSKDEIVELLGLNPANVTVVAPGVDPKYTPGGERSDHPLVVAVGRLVPVKRFPLLIDALVALRRRHPTLEAIIVGEGYERPLLEARIRGAGAQGWLRLPGRVSDDELIDLYRRAWVVASTSAREGWGMTLTEAAACGTPAVATRIAGHLDAVADGASGFLVGDHDATIGQLDLILGDPTLRDNLARGAERHAARLTWADTARGTLEVLVGEARRHRTA
jgi:glycosyltransferase involved in cell wall biosynthesis